MEACRQGGLLPEHRLIGWLPDETVYSLASRFHRLSGNTRFDITARQLFGTAHGGYPHDLPSGIRHFASVFAGDLGSVEAIIRERTILPFFMVLREASQRQYAISALASAQIGSLKAKLGLLASRLGAHCPLKACLVCIDADRREHGTAYWHRTHQFPGVWICRRHEAPLAYSISSRAGTDRFGWTLPEPTDIPITVDDRSAAGNSAASWTLAALIDDAVSDTRVLSPSRVSMTLLATLQKLGLARSDGRLHPDRVSTQFAQALEGLSGSTEIVSLNTGRAALYGQVLHSLRSPATGHALRHFLVLHWLYGSWHDFIACYESPQPEAEELVPAETPGRRHPARSHLVELVGERGLSPSAAAHEVGVSVVTAQAWLAAAGHELTRRPSKLERRTLDRLIADLAAGADITVAAGAAGVSVTSANRILRTEIGLLERRQRSLEEQRRAASRRSWKAALRSCGSSSLARQLAAADYAWLYRNDRDWLNEANATVPRRQPCGPRLDWESRDRDFCARVQTAALVLFERGNRKIRLATLLRETPELKAKLDVLHLMPRTAKVLRMLLVSRTRQ